MSDPLSGVSDNEFVMLLSLEVIWSLNEPVIGMHQKLDTWMGKCSGHDIHYQGEDPWDRIQAEWEDCELRTVCAGYTVRNHQYLWLITSQ